MSKEEDAAIQTGKELDASFRKMSKLMAATIRKFDKRQKRLDRLVTRACQQKDESSGQ